ncbi:MAG: thrombospondin type 3 repeat-containing protein, partial [Pseudomonadota bacterium]
ALDRAIPSDVDNDGIPDLSDNCPTVCNPQQLDADNDSIGDRCDPTPGCGNGCGQVACETPCGTTTTTSVAVTTTTITAPVDTDHDGKPDIIDNCPTVCNPQQLDTDNDSIGDRCDPTPGCGSGCGQVACEPACPSTTTTL